ncbi:uncharacterized protein LOC127101819 [Lathyrus oleraceus]|uniref:uncharacterized protein LOC127101819 n=1 Tax=Pisum sativum TaxID=3888 RepID=UPI0021CFDD50|nr:uncharacterized protein LOC127101819 [Pisum sativum]
MYRSRILNRCMENLPQICVDTSDTFSTTQRFGTREEMIRWIKEVEIRNKVGNTRILIVESKVRPKKCGYPFKIRSTLEKDGSGWKVDVKCGAHNHGLPDRLEGNSFVGRLTMNEKQHVVDLTKRHVPPRHILLSLQDREPKNVIRITQIYKYKIVIKKDIRGPRSEIKHLFKLIEDADYVYWIMNNTYKTNKYRQPLFEIVGMTSTELTFVVAFAYMESEQTENFCWVLDKLKQLFHINKNVGAKCKQYVVNDMQKTIDILWVEVVWASDEVEYDQ